MLHVEYLSLCLINAVVLGLTPQQMPYRRLDEDRDRKRQLVRGLAQLHWCD